MTERKLDVYPQESVCPLCQEEADIEFDSGSVDDAGFTYYCTCGNCGATWHECYDLVFAGNWSIKDKDGNDYEDLPT